MAMGTRLVVKDFQILSFPFSYAEYSIESCDSSKGLVASTRVGKCQSHLHIMIVFIISLDSNNQEHIIFLLHCYWPMKAESILQCSIS